MANRNSSLRSVYRDKNIPLGMGNSVGKLLLTFGLIAAPVCVAYEFSEGGKGQAVCITNITSDRCGEALTSNEVDPALALTYEGVAAIVLGGAALALTNKMTDRGAQRAIIVESEQFLARQAG